MKIVCISDTHTQHDQIILPKGDVLVHAGDATYRGNFKEVSQFAGWLGRQLDKFKHIIFIPGNHDFLFEENFNVACSFFKKEIHILNDSEVEIDGIKFWGSPITPEFNDWAFNRKRGEEIKKHWDKIPENTNVLVTHGPPYGILDSVEEVIQGNPRMMYFGCQDLLNTLINLKNKPQKHIFGHIHYSHGQASAHGIEFINASQVNEQYFVVNKPIVIEI